MISKSSIWNILNPDMAEFKWVHVPPEFHDNQSNICDSVLLSMDSFTLEDRIIKCVEG
jgi:hypothetical protein